MLNFNALCLDRQARAARHGLLETAAGFFLSEVMLQLFANLPKNSHDVGAGRVAIWATTRNDGSVRQAKHPVQAAVLRNEMFDVALAFVVIAHGSFPPLSGRLG